MMISCDCIDENFISKDEIVRVKILIYMSLKKRQKFEKTCKNLNLHVFVRVKIVRVKI